MKKYSEFALTPFDLKGSFLRNRQDWLVVPVYLSRDSDNIRISNFHAALKRLGGPGENVEIHKLRHGRLKIILVRPGSPEEKIAEDLEAALSDYPVLDDMDYSQRQYQAICEKWRGMDLNERIYVLKLYNGSIFSARKENPFEIDLHNDYFPYCLIEG